MSVAINTVTIGGIEDRRLVLSNASVARTITAGTSWSRIRIGVRLAFDDSGASIINGALWIGMMTSPSANMANGPLSNNCSNFAGFQPWPQTETRYTSPQVRYTFNEGFQQTWGVVRVGNTTTAKNISGYYLYTEQSALPATKRTAIVIELKKESVNSFSIAAAYSTATDYADLTYAAFITSMQQSTISGVGTSLATLSGKSYGVQDSTGISFGYISSTPTDQNAVCVAWNMATPAVNISDIVWAKIA